MNDSVAKIVKDIKFYIDKVGINQKNMFNGDNQTTSKLINTWYYLGQIQFLISKWEKDNAHKNNNIHFDI